MRQEAGSANKTRERVGTLDAAFMRRDVTKRLGAGTKTAIAMFARETCCDSAGSILLSPGHRHERVELVEV